jgi:hypothetical protein
MTSGGKASPTVWVMGKTNLILNAKLFRGDSLN